MTSLTTHTPVNGLHHITAISGSATRTHEFWTRGLGLRFVKKTVNFDDPGTYHLYFGDAEGRPGTIMTHFPWAGVPRGRAGSGEANVTQLSIPQGSLGFWMDRLATRNVETLRKETLFGETRLVATDPDGLVFALVERADDPRAGWTTAETAADVAVRGFHGVSLTLHDGAPTAAILTDLLGYEKIGQEGAVTRYRATGTGEANVVDIVEDRRVPRAGQGAGRIHHIAFSVADDAAEMALRARLVDAGVAVTPQIDRTYFRSLYFRTPGGVLFEIATDVPGFAVDEPVDALGSSLKLPPQHEPLRDRIEAVLPPLAA